MASAHFGQAHLSSPQADTFQPLLAFVLAKLGKRHNFRRSRPVLV
jgi:hypothetical protein